MNRGRHINKLQLVRQHRENQHLFALNQLIEGKVSPEYVAKRYEKLKAVRRK